MNNEEMWAVDFSLEMEDVTEGCPVLTGTLCVWGHDIFNVLEKATEKLKSFGFDRIIITGAHDSKDDKKEEVF